MNTDKNHIYSIKCIAVVIGAVLALLAGSTLFVNQAKADETASLEADGSKCQVMYRLYNKWTGEHFYTADKDEQANLQKVGWSYEGAGWYAPTSSKTPVYRLYNKHTAGGDHHYTMDKSEYDKLVKLGWSGEGVGWYSDDNKEVPVLRQYNPNEFANNHNFTTNSDENNTLVKAGWKAEGEAWYGVTHRVEAYSTAQNIYSGYYTPFYIKSNCKSDTFSVQFFDSENNKVDGIRSLAETPDDVDTSNMEGTLALISIPKSGTLKMRVKTDEQANFTLNVIDSEKERNEYIDKWIKELTSSSMDSFEKMDAIEAYLYPKMKYQRGYNDGGGHYTGPCTLLEDYGTPWWKDFVGTSYTTPQYLYCVASRIGGFTDIHYCANDYPVGSFDWMQTHARIQCSGVNKLGKQTTKNYEICPSSDSNVVKAKNSSELEKVDFNDLSKFYKLSEHTSDK